MKTAHFYFLLGILVGGPLVRADELNLSSGRPLAMEDAWPTEAGDAQFQAGAGYQTQRTAKDQVFFPFQLNIGIVNRLDVELQSTLYSAPRSVEEVPHSGDLAAGGQWQLAQEHRFLPALAFKGMLNLPTGVASAGLGAILKALFTKHVGQTIVDLNGVVDLLGREDAGAWPQRFTEVIGIERPLMGEKNHRLAFLSDLYTQRALARADADTVGAEVGLMKGLGADLSVDAGIGSEFMGAADRRRCFFNTGLSWSL